MSVDDIATRPPGAVQRASSPRGWDAGRSGGRLIVAWQHPERRLISPVGRLEHRSASEYVFRYLRRAPDVAGFRPFLSFPTWERTYVAAALFPMFAQRIMSPRRPDYGEFLRQLDLDADASPWEQLARSEGRSRGDTVQVFPVPVVENDGTSSCRFLVHGLRHVLGVVRPPVAPGDQLRLKDDPENDFNPAAVGVWSAAGQALGYVPDLLLDHLTALRNSGAPVNLVVEHVNGPDAPAHLRLLARLDGQVPPAYQPMAGSGWETFIK